MRRFIKVVTTISIMRKIIRYTPRQMRKMSRNDIQTHVENRIATLSKRSIGAWNRRNDVMSRPHASLSDLDTETLILIANALNYR